LRIHGRVQGVWYRGWLIEEAKALSVDGWVRNRLDGSVEAVIAGEAAVLRELIRRCHEGPKLARVTAVTEAAEARVPEPGFTQRPTA